MHGDIYDRDGNPITLSEYAGLLEDENYKRVARSEIVSLADPGRMLTVSTVWLGIDHSFGHGYPVIFETMVFGDSALEEDCRRYSTLSAAYEGHRQAVATVAATMPGETLVVDDG